MNPIAFTIFGVDVRWYGIFMASGILIASFILMKLSEKKGYSNDLIYDLILVIVPSGIIGARTYYVIFEWDNYKGDFYKIINLRGGGLAIHGAIIAGLLSAYIYCKIKKINFLEILDMAAPGIILAQAIGRWGNFANSEAHGGPTDLPWAIVVEGQKVHPTFLYESLWNFMVFILLMYLYKRKKFDGQIFLNYAILYSLARFFIEGLRTDSLMWGSIRVAQFISVVIILVSLLVYYMKIKEKNMIKK